MLLPAPVRMAPDRRPSRSSRSYCSAPPRRPRWIRQGRDRRGPHALLLPPARGWPGLRLRSGRHVDLLPVCSGMGLCSNPCKTAACSAPRLRGDGLVSAYAGMDPGRPPTATQRASASRARGDGPVVRLPSIARSEVPVPPGVDPSPGAAPRWRSAAPRARGDGPCGTMPVVARSCCSPHPRGMPPSQGDEVAGGSLLPAYVGMALTTGGSTVKRGTASRSRGWILRCLGRRPCRGLLPVSVWGWSP